VPQVVRRQVSADGTRKYLLRVAGGHEVETVYIPDADRGTLCISSQVGCTLTCSFCHTGTQRLVRNLTAAEIVGQIMVARDDLGEWPAPGRVAKDETRLISNIVLMGMGEPLYNFEAVRDAMKIAMDHEGISLSRRRITLSTSGIVPEIARTGAEIGCMLAVSFHATPMRSATAWCRSPEMEHRRFARTRCAAIRPCRIPNASPSNTSCWTGSTTATKMPPGWSADRRHPGQDQPDPVQRMARAPYRRSPEARIRAFADIVYKAGYAAPIRTPRGEDIMAACGQLKSDSARAPNARRVVP
jgi:23S rRNA (adenine2503-C2)-methyltransferase